MANKFERAFPIGARVNALEPMGGWQEGIVTTHTISQMNSSQADGLIVKFDDDSWATVPYGYIDIESADNSYVVMLE